MPILAKNNEYVVPLTFQCNWKCSYCAVRNKYDYRENVSHEEILQKIDIVPENSIVTLTGGEPGLIEHEKLKNYIQLLSNKHCQLYLETNGLFIVKHHDLCNCFVEILYHCTNNMDLNDNIIIDSNLPLRYVVIVNDINIINLKQFLEKYNQIKFDIIEATYPYADCITGPTLSKHNKHMILTKFAAHMTKDSIKRFIKEKDFNKITWLFDIIARQDHLPSGSDSSEP